MGQGRQGHQGHWQALGAIAFALASTGAWAGGPWMQLRELKSSYWLPARAQCQGMPLVSDNQIWPSSGVARLGRFSARANAPCMGLGRIGPGGDATATLTAALTGVIWPDWLGWTRSELTLDVTADARARQAGNTAYAGLFKLEVGGAQSVFLLTNGGDAPGLVRLRCTRQMSAARTLGPAAGESVAFGTITLERPDYGTSQTICDAAPNTTDADKQEETALVCLGPHTMIAIDLDGSAGAKVHPTTWEESAYQASAHLSVVFEQDQTDFSLYPPCTRGPGGSWIQILPRGVSPIVGDPTDRPGGLPVRRP